MKSKLFSELPKQTEDPHKSKTPNCCFKFLDDNKLNKSTSHHNTDNIIEKPRILNLRHEEVKPHHCTGEDEAKDECNFVMFADPHEQILRVHDQTDEAEHTDEVALEFKHNWVVAKDHLQVQSNAQHDYVHKARHNVVGERQKLAVLYVPRQDQHQG